MGNSNVEAGPGQQGKPQSNLMRISLCANLVLAVLAVVLAIWGYGRHQDAKEKGRRVVEADRKVVESDQKVVAANEERDEAYEVSRNLQYGLIKAKGELKGISDPFGQRTAREDADSDTPP